MPRIIYLRTNKDLRQPRQTAQASEIQALSLRCSASDEGSPNLILTPSSGDLIHPPDNAKHAYNPCSYSPMGFATPSQHTQRGGTHAGKDFDEISVPVSHAKTPESKRIRQTCQDLTQSADQSLPCTTKCALAQVREHAYANSPA